MVAVQIQPNFGNYGLPSGKGDPLIQVGDTVKVNIQKVLSDNEAIVSLNGQAVKITIDGDLKNQTNVYLKITDIPAEGQWKGTIVEAPAEKSFPPNLLQNVLEGGSSKDIQQLLSTLKKAGYPINETTLRKVAALLSQTNGTPKEKIEALGMMLDKKYPLENRFFQPIMAALFGKETPKIGTDSMMFPEIENLIEKAINEALKGNEKQDLEVNSSTPKKEESSKARNRDESIDIKSAHPSTDSTKLETPRKVQAEPPLSHSNKRENAIQMKAVEQLAPTLLKSDEVTFKNSEEKSLSTNAVSAQPGDLNHTIPANLQSERIIESDSLTDGVRPTSDLETMSVAQNSILNSIPPLSAETKNVIVTFISKELQETTKQFSSMKRSVEASLQHIEQKLPAASPEQAKKWLDTTIKKLDQTLMKSDFMLYADMKTEKNVLEASTLLQQAKKQISLGNTAEASKIVQQVKQLITSADYKPSQVKMVHLVQDRLLTKNESHRPVLTQDSATPRQVYETLRKTGLQDERELWQRAVLKQGSAVQQSVKQALLSSTSEASGKAVTQAEQAVQHITGQQLLSKQDQGGNMQSLFFQLPVLLQAEAQDMKIFIQSQKNEGTIDWQNCSMYVEFETAKLGRMGILLTIQDRDATLTLKHDRPDLLEKATGLAEQMKKGLGYLGLRITSVQQQAFQSVDEDVKKEQSTSVRETKEGFDYLI